MHWTMQKPLRAHLAIDQPSVCIVYGLSNPSILEVEVELISMPCYVL